MTREEIAQRGLELNQEKKYLEDREHKLYKDAQELEEEYLKTSIYPKDTVFTYAGNLISLSNIKCNESGYKSYKYFLSYSFNLISSNGKVTSMILLRDQNENRVKEMVRDNKLIPYDGEIEIKSDTEWPKEVHAYSIKAKREFKESNNIYDYIIESKECENPRKKVKTYITKYYRIQTEIELRNDWYIKPRVDTNRDGIELSFELYMRRWNGGRRARQKYGSTYVTKIDEKDLFETLLDFS